MAEHSSRRNFLRHATAGTAAVGAVVLTPVALGRGTASAQTRTAAATSGAVHQGPLVAYVKNARTGEIAVMAGEREIVHHDPQLAAHLGRIAATSKS
ncbi:twin-arginine translocation signal domain-containing protein [Streptacidiphilus sp. 4-A2]|nr:twin-arginine translocation signal domain-containing protein [Streptacidiphilus sp. 4-A2]